MRCGVFLFGPSFGVISTQTNNAEFAEFVTATNYKTDSEKFGWSFVFVLQVSPELNAKITQSVRDAPWWLPV
jgi:sulfatase modifying factor 1